MSTGGGVQTPICQGFLKKRKDKIKLRWVTYWFRLYNTTLFFYTKKHGSALDLRGQYYIYEVQSVREVSGTENKGYLFEMTMKSGKKKMLAADTADVRQLWMEQLWKAMMLNGPDRTRPVPDGEQISDNKSETQPCLSEDTYARDNRCLSFDQESFHSFRSITDDKQSLHTDNEMEMSTEEISLTDYDILPPRKYTDETLYNPHPNNWPSNKKEHGVTEIIYDVPNALIRKKSEQTVECHSSSVRPESGGLLDDMIASLGSESAAWVKTAPL
ncbi:uncharacterized protein LOC130426660 isoform X3 [Triplophysa dalaica]|uniref:uncharacterized protein LOC130426660 isoform X3 n=1 Tax=Triplophysa dalaica TaxID=1582913 RepID=UPI0024E01FA1|nr:uncharacterized protein LOC130426660 isoform X3 [Triplophysa dalaica]